MLLRRFTLWAFDTYLRLKYRERVPRDFFDVEIPADVELRYAARELEKASKKVSKHIRGRDRIEGTFIAPMGASARTVLVHPAFIHSRSREGMNRILAHELGHVQQFRRWGPITTLVLCRLGCRLFGYERCPVEREAWELADDIRMAA